MAFFTSNPSQHQTQLYSITPCKCPWILNNSCKFQFPSSPLTFSPPKHPLRQPRFSPLLISRTPELSTTDQEISNEISDHSNNVQISSGFSQTGATDKRVGRKYKKKSASSVEVENPEITSAASDGDRGKRLDSIEEMGVFFEFFSTLFLESIRKYLEKNLTGNVGSVENNRGTDEKIGQGFDKQLGVDKRKKGGKRSKVNPEVRLKHWLENCSKIRDFLGAVILYDSARREGVKMDESHYTILLYLCSSAATADVQPTKSGGRSVSVLGPIGTVCSSNAKVAGKFVNSIEQWIRSGAMEMDYIWVQAKAGTKNFDSVFHLKDFVMEYNGKPNPEVEDGTTNIGIGDIKDGDNPKRLDIGVISTMIKKYALLRGFEIFNRMCSNEVPMNEANLTSVARMCMALGDGDMAFFMVKQMKLRGINPRLRSYGPALSAFSTCGDVDKAFSVEKHMLENGVYPEEPELEALLKVSVEASRSDKIYYLLHRFRTSVRKVSPSVAVLLEKWFTGKVASKVGKRKVDEKLIREAIENGGGGWHGQGWLGKGKWNVFRASVGTDGLCKCCGEKLASRDLDPKETEKFAESVASLAAQREKNSSFQQFQKWLARYGPFEAVVDGANAGVLAKRKFKSLKQELVEMLTRVNAVVKGVLPLLPSKQWPLIVLHNRRLTNYRSDKPVCKELIDKWKTANAFYATPTGSNDDWYWLYAAIKCKCLIVTNDEMRDHLFHLLGNDFFPRWKDRHQVRFRFSDVGLVIHMPPPYSIVIQESEKGHWHIPVASKHEGKGTWLCITRGKSHGSTQLTATMYEDNNLPGAMQVTSTIDEDNHSPWTTQVTATIREGNHSPDAMQVTQATAPIHEEWQSPVHNKGSESSDTPTKNEAILMLLKSGKQKKGGGSKQQREEFGKNVLNLLSKRMPSISKYPRILPQIKAAEKLGGCVIDFEI